MTVSYTSDIANGGRFVSFWRVLWRWRGSLYKLIWQDLLCYSVLFLVINYLHAHALSAQSQLFVQKVKIYLASNLSLFPIPFVLSFFVDQVAVKWWHQYQMLPSPDTLAIFTNAAIPGKDDQSRLMRRTIVRYAVLSLVLTLRNISTRIKNRFPTIKHVEEAGLILEDEKLDYDKLEGQVTANNWMPLVWAANIATHAKSLNKVSSDHCLRLLISELTAHRNKLGILVGYDLVCIPLVYTQTVVAVVMSYLMITLISNQPILEDNWTGPGGITVSSFTDFIIYVGLMKVATVMLNPLGEDDDDFELNASVDRHITAAYMIVDEMHEEEPEVVKDAYWDEIVPTQLPYTVGSAASRKLESDHYEQDESQPKKGRTTSRRSWKVGSSKKRKESCRVTSGSLQQKGFVGEHSKMSDSRRNVGRQEDAELYDCIDMDPELEPNTLKVQWPTTSEKTAVPTHPKRY